MNDTELRFLDAFNVMQMHISKNAIAHGFYEDESKRYFTCDGDGNFKQVDLSKYFKGNRIALQHSELSEGLESIRNSQFADSSHLIHVDENGKVDRMDEHCHEFTNLEIEMADCVIRIMDMCEFYKLRLAEAIIAKHNFNVSRPMKHGKAF